MAHCPPIAQTLLTSCHSLAPSCPPAGYLSVAHYLVLNKAGGLRAKRAALESGFCPPDLAGELWWGWYVGVGVCNLLLWKAQVCWLPAIHPTCLSMGTAAELFLQLIASPTPNCSQAAGGGEAARRGGG